MHSFIEKFYIFLPPAIQNALVSGYGLYWKRRRFSGQFNKHYKAFKSNEINSYLDWREYQNQELQKILLHSIDTVPFYQEMYIKAGFSRRDLKNINIDSMHELPILSKEELRKFGTTKLISSKQNTGARFYSSSGSTGTPTKILISNRMHQKWSAAFETRIRNWAGVTRFDPRGMIGGRRVVPEGVSDGPFYRYNIAEKQVYYSAYHISKKTTNNYLQAMSRYKLNYMTGYAMSNYLLAKNILELGFSAPKMKAVITSSEKLTSEMRSTFKEVYDCKTFDSYSGVEACGLISENEYGQLLISPDVGIMEILNEKGEPCKPGEVGEIFSTGFLNYDQPLIRYRIGDMVRLAKDQTTKCGRSMVVVDEIIGRSEDVVIGPDGRQMVRFHGIYVDIPGLIAGQLIQHSQANYTLNLQVEKNYCRAESESIIKQRLVSQLGDINVSFNYPEEIPTGPNGKFKAVISELKT